MAQTDGFPGVALVTGGSRGIGRAISLKLASQGYAVAFSYAAAEDAARAVVGEIEAAGGAALAIRSDAGDPEQIPLLFAQADTLGPLTALVTNAGVLLPPAPLVDAEPAALARLLDINVLGTMLCAQEAVRRMSTSRGGAGGGIVTLASIAARLARPGMAAYSASKAAVETLTRSLAAEVGPEGIRVNAVSPGFVETDMVGPEMLEIARQAPLGRTGRPEEIADAVAFLLSDASSFVTGSILTISGGR